MRSIHKVPALLVTLLGLSLVVATGCDKDKKLRVASLSPDHGPPGKKITIYGNGFQQGGMKRVEVFFGDYRADVRGYDGDDKLIVIAPSGPTLGKTVVVKVNFIGRGSVDHLRYTYKLPPKRMTTKDLVGGKKKKKKKKDE